MSRTRSTVLVFALLVVSLIAGAAPATAAPADAGDASQNDAGTLVITVDTANVTGNDTSVKITVSAANARHTYARNPTSQRSGSYRYEVTRKQLAQQFAGTSLANARVVVKQGNKTYVNETLDLRHLKLPKKRANLTQTQLSFPVTHALGISNGAKLKLRATARKTVTLTATYDGNRLVVSKRASYQSLLLAPTSVSVETATGGIPGSRTYDLTRAASTTAGWQSKGLVVHSPLLVKGETYQINVTTTNPPGQLVREVTAKSGELVVSGNALRSAESLSVAVSYGGTRIASRSSIRSKTTQRSGTITNGTLRVKKGTLPSATPKTVWANPLKGSGPLRFDNVSNVENGSGIRLTNASQLTNGTYNFLIHYSNGKRVVVQATVSQAADTATKASSGDGSGSGLLQQFPQLIVIVLAALILVVFFGYLGYLLTREAAGGAISGPTRHTVQISAVDEITDSPYGKNLTLRATRSNRRTTTNPSSSGGSDSVRETLKNGEGSIRLPEGDWTISLERNGSELISEHASVPEITSYEMTVPAGTVQPTVVDAETDEPVQGVTVECDPEVGESQTATTDRRGQVAFELSRQSSDVTYTARHERYETGEWSAAERSATLKLTPLKGSLDARVTVDGTSTSGLEVTLEALDDHTRAHLDGERRVRSDEQGRARFDDLAVGEYRLTGSVDAEPFRSDSATVTVDANQTTEATVSVGFGWSLTAGHRERMRSLRERADALGRASGRDTAIPQYYASVITSLLDAVDDLPNHGAALAGTAADPDAIAHGVLDATEDAVDGLEQAMSEKRCVDLFSACVHMDDDVVRWDGDFAVSDLTELLEAGNAERRRELSSRLEAVDDRIEREQGNVVEVAPAQTVYEQLRERVIPGQRDDDVTSAARVFVTLSMLDAIEGLFERDALTDRLNQTVF